MLDTHVDAEWRYHKIRLTALSSLLKNPCLISTVSYLKKIFLPYDLIFFIVVLVKEKIGIVFSTIRYYSPLLILVLNTLPQYYLSGAN